MQAKIKLFLIRYGLPIFYCVVFFLLICLINKAFSLLLTHRLYSLIILSINIRLLDDYFDYEIDLFNKRIIFNRNALKVIYLLSVIANIIIAIITKDVLLIALVILINIICLVRSLDRFKIAIMPLFMIYVLYTLDIKIINIILIVLSIVIAVMYFIYKRKYRN